METIRIENKGTVDQPWGTIHIDGDRTVEFWGVGRSLEWNPKTWPPGMELTADDVDWLWRYLDAAQWDRIPAGGVLHEFDAYWNSLTEEERDNVTAETLAKMRAAVGK